MCVTMKLEYREVIQMKKFIYKTFITLSLICLFQVKAPIFHMTHTSIVNHCDFITPCSDVPITSNDKK